MELVDLKNIRPDDYMREGFFDDQGELREGLSGMYSLAMAYRCRDEKMTPDALHGIVGQLQSVAEGADSSVDDNPDQPLNGKAVASLERIWQRPDVAGSATLAEIVRAARPQLNRWKDLAALVLHLDRMVAQLAMIENLPRED
jgi:hypothetical protein